MILDNFTSSILSNWYMEEVVSSIGANSIVNVEVGYVCGRNGHIMRQKPDLDSWTSISKGYFNDAEYEKHPQILVSIWTQLFSTFAILSEYNFDYPYFNKNNIQIQFENTEYEYDNVTIDSNVTVKLYFPDGASIDVFTNDDDDDDGDNDKKYRIYNNNKIDMLIHKDASVVSIRNIKYVNCNMVDFCIVNKQCYVQINHNNYDKKNNINNINNNYYRRYIEYGLIPNSVFTVYMAILTMTKDTFTFRTIMNDDRLYDFWEQLWHPGEFDKVHSIVKNNQIKNNDDIVQLLVVSRLRCDVAEYAWNTIKDVHTEIINK
jgi:ABC-type antimicrobial peptide transport system permease subunit